MSIFHIGEEWQRLSNMFSYCEIIFESFLQAILQWFIIYIAYWGSRSLSLFQFVTFCSSMTMVFIHITRPFMPKKLRHGPEEPIWFAIKRIVWPILFNGVTFVFFAHDVAITHSMFYGTNMFIVLMSTQLSYLCISILLSCKDCLGPSRQIQLKYFLWGGMNLIWCAKNCYAAFVCTKHTPGPGENFPYETAIFNILCALSCLLFIFLLVKSAVTLESFSEFWDADKVFKSNFWFTLCMIQLVVTMVFMMLCDTEEDLFLYNE